MSAIPRIASVSMSVASASVISLGGVIAGAPTALAEPCTGAAANAMPPPTAQMPPSPEGHLPTGHRPSNANDNAPLPRLGQLPLEIIKSFSPQSATVQQQAAVAPAPAPPAQQAPAAPPPAAASDPGTPPGTSIVGWVTGLDSPENTLDRFAISGTDLGIMWDNGDPANNQVLVAFGDTYGYCGAKGQQWRYNTLFRTNDRALVHGLSIPPGSVSDQYAGSPEWRPGISRPILPAMKWAQTETGIIPTAGIAVGKTQILNFMSIKSWDSNGAWTTNYSALAVSTDNGQTWRVSPATVRTPGEGSIQGVPFVPGNEKFQQGAFLRTTDGFVYSFGTGSGRSGAAFVSRVPSANVLDPSKYQYWNADQNTWVAANPAAATPVIPGPVGEMSVQYNTYLKQYLMLYCNGLNDVVARTAPAPQGPWSPERLLVASNEIPGGIYAPYLHPWSTGKDIYYNLSLWSAYNVMLMHTVLP
jgi:hypothetical protein